MTEEQEVYQVQKKSKPKGRRHSGNAVSKMLTIRFKSRDQYERVCRHAEAQGISINEWCVEQLLKGIEPTPATKDSR
jgi:predicted HicB family RNase H-like nuclease